MTYDLELLFGASVCYLLILFFIAYATDSGIIPERWIKHPLVYILSLGVYATSWSFYGSVGFAEREGFQFLTIYLGVTFAFMLTPLLLKPILRITSEYQLTSLADLFAFRYRSQLAGVLVTLFMLVGSLPYIALQIRAVTESLQILTKETTPHLVALWFCVILILFAVLFGARHISPREKHVGLVAAIAFESLVKLIALLSVGLFAIFGVFSGPGDLAQWLIENPQATEALYKPIHEGPWLTLMFLAFAAAFLLPRQFHMAFTENLSPRLMDSASWGFPLFLLLINLTIPPILWAGQYLNLGIDPDYYVLGIVMTGEPSWLPIITFIGGVSAASAMVIVTTLALSSMCLNHLLLPASYPNPRVDIYHWLLWSRRLLIGVIIMGGFIFYQTLEHNQGLAQLGLISFVAVAQFIPGIIGALFWQRASRHGFVLGLLGGITVWAITLLTPLLEASGLIDNAFDLQTLRQTSGLDHWEFATFWSLAVNMTLFVVASLLSTQSKEEQEAAQACRSGAPEQLSGVVTAHSPKQFMDGLSGIIGKRTATREVTQALHDLKMSAHENRSSELRRLRERIERNLSGLVGPHMAHMIINQRLEMDSAAKTALADSMRYVEQQLSKSRSRLRGLTADLDNMRRYHQQILLDLPLGVCSIEADQSVVIWNLALETMSGVPSHQAVGWDLKSLPSPWNDLLTGFALAQDSHIHHMEVSVDGRPRWFNLHKATVLDQDQTHMNTGSRTSLVMLLEDLTDLEVLEAELAHTDRLASIGRLAAGVAHEIGNPVTGIHSLAQNMRDEPDQEQNSQSIEAILQQTRRISNIVKSLMNFSRSGNIGTDHREFMLNEIIEESVRLVQLTHKSKQMNWEVDCPDDLAITGDRQRLSQVLVNLLTNACDASDSSNTIKISAQINETEVVVDIIDQGNGIPSDVQDFVFEPFFTTKAPGEGTGLGLSLAHKIIQEHSGKITVDSEPDIGTTVEIRLPLTNHI